MHHRAVLPRSWCEMENKAGWLRVGKEGLDWNWQDESAQSVTIQALAQEDIELLALYDFTEYKRAPMQIQHRPHSPSPAFVSLFPHSDLARRLLFVYLDCRLKVGWTPGAVLCLQSTASTQSLPVFLLSCLPAVRWHASCDTSLFAQADDSTNQHRVFYMKAATLMAKDTSVQSMLMGYGSDNTAILNRAATCKSPSSHSTYGPRGCTPEASANNADCMALFCTGSHQQLSTCGQNGKPGFLANLHDVIFVRFEFRPRAGSASGNQWERNRYSLKGTKYFIYVK